MKNQDHQASLASFLATTIKQDYDSEKRVLRELDVLIEKAEDEELKEHFKHHKHETKNQIERLDQVFLILEKELKQFEDATEKTLVEKTLNLIKKVTHYAPEAKCHGTKGIFEDGHAMLTLFEKTTISDDVLIAASLRLEHFEIATYQMIRNTAEQLGLQSVSDILKESQDEENSMAEKLSRLAVKRKLLTLGFNQ
jgi:ferritin-like metal-binding protein YciE